MNQPSDVFQYVAQLLDQAQVTAEQRAALIRQAAERSTAQAQPPKQVRQ